MDNTGYKDSETAAKVRADFLAVKGNEGALDGIQPSDELVDANLADCSLTGAVPTDVLSGLFSGRFKGGIPEAYVAHVSIAKGEPVLVADNPVQSAGADDGWGDWKPGRDVA